MTSKLNTKLCYTSVEYPQGNGLNENAHCILETVIKSRVPEIGVGIRKVVADAVLFYNVTLNRNIGDTPASVVFGTNLHIPGLEDWELPSTEETGLTKLQNNANYKHARPPVVNHGCYAARQLPVSST